MQIPEIKWHNVGDCTEAAAVPGGALIKYTATESEYSEGHGFFVDKTKGETICFVPDPRITLAGQIVPGLMAAGGYPTDVKVRVIARDALAIADEILKQAAESEAENG